MTFTGASVKRPLWTSLEMLVLLAVIYSAVHVFFALLIMVVSRKFNALFPSIMLGVLVGGTIGLPLGTAMKAAMHWTTPAPVDIPGLCLSWEQSLWSVPPV